MYLTQGLQRALQRHPSKPAVTHLGEAGNRRHDFAQLADGVAHHAAALGQRGVKRGDPVALLAPINDHLVRAILACWWMGAVACPLNVRWSAQEVQYALQDSEAALLLADESLRALAPEGPTPVLSFDEMAAEAAACAPLADTRTGGDALAAILYTGGTTGRSKGVLLSHANFWTASMTRGAELNNAPDSVSLLVVPLFHVAGLGRLVGQMIVGGGCVTMAQFRSAAVIEAIETHGISDILVVPTMLQSLLDDPAFTPERVRSLDRVAFGAAPMPPDLLDRALAAWPHAEFFQAYGLTETAGAVCINLPSNHRLPARPNELLSSVGRAGLGAEIMVTDEGGLEVPRGEVGEIVVRGPMVTQGYWRQPETTAAAFRDGWFRTGDAGRMLPDGHLFVVDRLKDMIITGGENVYCAEVETALRSHPDVSQAAVIGVPDARWGERVHAVVVLADGAVADAEALRDWCRERLAHYKCPRDIRFVRELPLSAAGKVLKNVLRAQVQA